MATVKHPNGSTLRVTDASVARYVAAGWTKVDADKPTGKAAKAKSSAKDHDKSSK
jgi:hypothetical protein